MGSVTVAGCCVAGCCGRWSLRAVAVTFRAVFWSCKDGTVHRSGSASGKPVGWPETTNASAVSPASGYPVLLERKDLINSGNPVMSPVLSLLTECPPTPPRREPRERLFALYIKTVFGWADMQAAYPGNGVVGVAACFAIVFFSLGALGSPTQDDLELWEVQPKTT